MVQFRKVISNNSVPRINVMNRKAQKRFGANDTAPDSMTFSILNDIFYKGRNDRFQRYAIYDQMDQDVDIYRALDIIAEHCTQKDDKSETPFKIVVDDGEIGQEDADVLFTMMKIWNKLNGWDNLAFRAIRNVIKYGDAFFIRDENFKLFPVHPSSVEGIYADEDTGEIQAYKLCGIRRKFSCMVNLQVDATSNNNTSTYQRGSNNFQGQSGKSKTYNGLVTPENLIHLSLNEGLDVGGNGSSDIWPFGESFLDSIFKDYKSRSLLEDAEIIHRIQRAPSRRVFYVATGKMRADKQDGYVRKFKNEIQQKRIPSNYGGKDTVDSIYNPISQMEDLFIPVDSEGKGSKVENLEGQAWSNPEILQYFNSKMMRGLRVPTSFMLGPEEGGSLYNDGRTGTAYMQELQFSKSCERVQNLIDNKLDFEYKMFLKYRAIEVHNGYFDVKFVPPMNFDEYRQRSLYDERLATLSSALANPFFSKRFAMKKFGFFTDDEILENEQMWKEENLDAQARQYNQDNNLGGMGVGMGSFNNAFGADGTQMPTEAGLGGPGVPGATGELGTGAGGVGGASTPAAGGAPGGATGMESYIKPLNAKMLQEDILDELNSDSDQEQKKAHDDNYEKDEGWAKKIEQGSEKPVMTLGQIRKLRMLRDKNRKEMVKRLMLLKQMYAQPPATAGGGGLGF